MTVTNHSRFIGMMNAGTPAEEVMQALNWTVREFRHMRRWGIDTGKLLPDCANIPSQREQKAEAAARYAAWWARQRERYEIVGRLIAAGLSTTAIIADTDFSGPEIAKARAWLARRGIIARRTRMRAPDAAVGQWPNMAADAFDDRQFKRAAE